MISNLVSILLLFSRDALIEMVIDNIIHGDEYSASRLKGILSLWDTTSTVLKVIENKILTWGEKNSNHENDVADSEKKGMANLISFLEGKTLGKVEVDMVSFRFIGKVFLCIYSGVSILRLVQMKEQLLSHIHGFFQDFSLFNGKIVLKNGKRKFL